jgi:hypothetical protein
VYAAPHDAAVNSGFGLQGATTISSEINAASAAARAGVATSSQSPRRIQPIASAQWPTAPTAV